MPAENAQNADGEMCSHRGRSDDADAAEPTAADARDGVHPPSSSSDPHRAGQAQYSVGVHKKAELCNLGGVTAPRTAVASVSRPVLNVLLRSRN